MKKTLIFACALVMLAGCREIKPEDGTNQTAEMVTFKLSENSTKVILDNESLKMSFAPGDFIKVNGVDYPVTTNTEGAVEISVQKSPSGIYSCVFSGPQSFMGAVSDNNYKVSNVQKYAENSIAADAMPMYCVKDTNADEDPVLHFTSLMGVIKIPVNANGVSIRSIKLEDAGWYNNSEFAMSGRAAPCAEDGNFVSGDINDTYHHLSFKGKGTAVMKEIVLLCNDAEGNGVYVDGTKDFYFVVEPRTYANGLKVTINDNDNLSMSAQTSGATTVDVASVVTMQPLTYSPDPKLIFSENFDTCVWGADPVGMNAGNANYRGLMPATSGGARGTIAGMSYRGCESGRCYSDILKGNDSDGNPVTVLCPGTDIYADYQNLVFTADYHNMSECTTKKMSDSFFKYRGLWDWFFSRTLEYHGYLLVGRSAAFSNVEYTKGISATGSPQGGIHTPRMTNIPAGETCNIVLRFKVAKDYANPYQPFMIVCNGDGMITSFTCGARNTVVDPSGVSATITDFGQISNTWNECEVAIHGATSNTFFTFRTPDGKNPEGTNFKTTTFFLDDVIVTKGEPTPPSTAKRIGFLGDSITTFAGHCEGGSFYYPYDSGNPATSLTRVEDTYWWRLVNNLMNNATVDKVLAYGGTTVVNNLKDPRTDFLVRCDKFVNPDIIFIHGGTNDKNQSIELGTFDYDLGENELDETLFRSAYIKLIKKLNRLYPNAQLMIIIGDMLTEGYYTSVEEIATHYSIPYVSFTGYNLPKCTGSHPNVAGMQTMANTIYSQLREYLE